MRRSFGRIRRRRIGVGRACGAGIPESRSSGTNGKVVWSPFESGSCTGAIPCTTVIHKKQINRTFYVTGFKDNCPRQFTAVLALFGSPQIHDQLRYGKPSKLDPYSTTDKAYEKMKSPVCKVVKKTLWVEDHFA